MKIHQQKLNESYTLFRNWWDNVELTNYEKCVLNPEIISFNQQLLRLKENKIRVGIFGKSGVGKSSILNSILRENFFSTGVLNGSTMAYESKELKLEKGPITNIELIDSPGFDSCKSQNQEAEINYLINLDLIFFVATGDLNRKELEILLLLIEKGKNIIIILNKVDNLTNKDAQIIKNTIKNKLPNYCKIPVITHSINNTYETYKKEKIYHFLIDTLNEIGYSLLIYNTYQIANKLALDIKEKRLLKRKKKAQALIGKIATLKASSIAINPLIFIDVFGGVAFDTLLISELSKIYGLKIKSKSKKALVKSLSINNVFLGAAQIGINTSFNLIKKVSLVLAPFTNGLSLLPYGSVAIAQAAIAAQTTKTIGKIAAKEILKKSNINNLEPFTIIQKIALKEPEIIGPNKIFLYNQSKQNDYSIFVP